MICEPCREPHMPADCVDAAAEREGAWRACCCQHQPRLEQVDTTDAPKPVGGQEQNRSESTEGDR